MRRTVIISFISVLFFGCYSTETANPEKAFEYWTGYTPPKEFNVTHGQYYKSPHFTLEYQVYLKFEPSSDWWNMLFEQRQLVADTTSWQKYNDAPDWFQPSKDSRMFWTGEPYDYSRYFIDRKTGVCFIFEIYGM